MTTAATPTAFCALCQSPIGAAEPTTGCAGCGTVYHADCWTEVGGCGVYGCNHVPATEKRSDLELPAAHWGQESKTCPCCNQLIQAMAMRCRHCGTAFASADPLSRRDYLLARGASDSRPRLKRITVWLFIACALPFTTVLAGPLGALWYFRKRQEVDRLPRLFSALVWIGLGLSACQLAIVIVVLLLKALTGR